MVKRNARKAWNEISKSYQERYQIGISKMHWGPFCPDEKNLNLLGDVHGKRTIEIGSGAAQNSIVLAKRGAIPTAFDISDEQLKYGRRLAKSANVNINFVRGNFEEIERYFEPESFDVAFSVYALQYCMSVNSMQRTFSQIKGLLKSAGIFAFSLDHPVRTIGYWDKESDQFILDDYFDRSEKEWDYVFPETGVSAKMRGSFKTISDIVNALIDVGFGLDKLLEPEPIRMDNNTKFGEKSRYGKHSKEDPYSYDHLSRIPGTLIIKARKY